jgi:uncharacterized protein YcbX
MTPATVRSLFTYPVKGLSPQPLNQVELRSGEGFPLDRVYALARRDGQYRPGMTEAIRKQEFHMLANDARLAGLTSELHRDGRTLTIAVRGHVVLTADLTSDEGQEAVSRFIGRVLDLPDDQLPVVAHSAKRRFTDVSVRSDAMMNAVSLINLDSVYELGERIGATIDPLRFRANVYLDGWAPFSEAELVGRRITIGSCEAEVVLATHRCAATEVDPVTARRNIPVPRLLVENYGTDALGIYAQILTHGTIRNGDTVRVHEVAAVS